MPCINVSWIQLFTALMLDTDDSTSVDNTSAIPDDVIKECIIKDYADFVKWVRNDEEHSSYDVYDWNYGDLKLNSGGDYIVIRVYYPSLFELNVEMDDYMRIISFSLERF